MGTFPQSLLDELSYGNKNFILLRLYFWLATLWISHSNKRRYRQNIFWILVTTDYYTHQKTPRSRILIDNISLTDTIDESSVSGNLMCSISDHPAQFLIYPEQNAETCLHEKTKYKRNYKKINKEKLEQDLEHINGVEILKVNGQNVDT